MSYFYLCAVIIRTSQQVISRCRHDETSNDDLNKTYGQARTPTHMG